MDGLDYAVGSHAVQGFDYVIQVCRDLHYADDTCTEGSGVCERHRQSELTTQVFGYTASTTLAWDDAQDGIYGQGSKLILAMSGAPCWSDNTTAAKVEIDFVCSQKEFVALKHAEGSTRAPVEDCSVAFTFYTAQACGSPRYDCFDGAKCGASLSETGVLDFSGEFATFEGCRASCGDKPPSYDCAFSAANGFQCIEDPFGNFTSFGDCEASCSLKAARVVR